MKTVARACGMVLYCSLGLVEVYLYFTGEILLGLLLDIATNRFIAVHIENKKFGKGE